MSFRAGAQSLPLFAISCRGGFPRPPNLFCAFLREGTETLPYKDLCKIQVNSTVCHFEQARNLNLKNAHPCG